MRAVLDVGQFVSATISTHGHPAQIVQAWRNGEFDIVASSPLLEDLRRVLFYPHIRKRHRWSDDQILDFMMQHPILINRPIVVTPLGTKLCRPSEVVLDLLSTAQRGPFTKEDGEVIIDAEGKRVG